MLQVAHWRLEPVQPVVRRGQPVPAGVLPPGQRGQRRGHRGRDVRYPKATLHAGVQRGDGMSGLDGRRLDGGERNMLP